MMSQISPQSLRMVPLSLPPFCTRNGEVSSMYIFSSVDYNWRCRLCEAVATEGHCQSPRHMKNVYFQFNRYRTVDTRQERLLPVNFETWRRQVTALGLNFEDLMQRFGARGRDAPHALTFTDSEEHPSLGQVERFWGDVSTFMSRS